MRKLNGNLAIQQYGYMDGSTGKTSRLKQDNRQPDKKQSCS